MTRTDDQTDMPARIIAGFKAQAMLRLLGAEMVEVGDGTVTIEMPFDARFTQQKGYLHAGATTTLADTAAGYAALTRMPAVADVLTIEFKMNLMAPGLGERFRARGDVVRSGRTITTVEARVEAYADGTWRETARFLGTMICLMPGR